MKKTAWIFAAASLFALVLGVSSVAQARRAPAESPAESNAALRTRIHAFLDRTIGWQQLDKMEVESISRPDASGLRTVKVTLAKGAQHQEGTYYITADGREIIQGEKSELSGDPWASNRAKIDLRGAPAIGPADAPVTIVEYSDLECPYCKEEATALANLMAQEPGKVRLVFKYFPLVEIHPWSMQAAQAAVCVTQQHPVQFWNFEKAVFAAQDQIDQAGAAAAPARLRDFALESGASAAAYDACYASPSTHATVEASIANGKSLGAASTPTLFINGRLIPGALQDAQLRMLVDHEAKIEASDSAHTASLSLGVKGKQCGECKPLPPIKHPPQR